MSEVDLKKLITINIFELSLLMCSFSTPSKKILTKGDILHRHLLGMLSGTNNVYDNLEEYIPNLFISFPCLKKSEILGIIKLV